MFTSLNVDAREKRWHAKAVHRALAAQTPRLSPDALEKLSALSVTVEVRAAEPGVDIAGDRAVVQLDCRGWTTMEAATPDAMAQLSMAVDALSGASSAPGIAVRTLDAAPPQEVFEAIRTAIRARVLEKVEAPRVVYDAFPLGSDGLPVDNLDRRAFEGRCRVEAQLEERGGYHSHVLENPSWLELSVVADQLLKATGEREQVFLEGLTALRVDDDVTVLELTFGS